MEAAGQGAASMPCFRRGAGRMGRGVERHAHDGSALCGEHEYLPQSTRVLAAKYCTAMRTVIAAGEGGGGG